MYQAYCATVFLTYVSAVTGFGASLLALLLAVAATPVPAHEGGIDNLRETGKRATARPLERFATPSVAIARLAQLADPTACHHR